MVITSRQNNRVKMFRDIDSNVFLVEGAKLAAEALSAGYKPHSALFTEKSRAANPALSAELRSLCPLDIVSGDISGYISDTKTPQGVFVLFCRDSLPAPTAEPPRLMLLDGVQDPGNAGAILRSCEAFGFGAVLSENCADPYSPKVLRSSAGSALRVRAERRNIAAEIARLRGGGYAVWGAALDESALPLLQAATAAPSKLAVVVGNEGKGISAEVLAMCDCKLYIPISGAESLNAAVAAGIICYQLGLCRGSAPDPA